MGFETKVIVWGRMFESHRCPNVTIISIWRLGRVERRVDFRRAKSRQALIRNHKVSNFARTFHPRLAK